MNNFKILTLFILLLIISLLVGCIDLTTPQLKIGPGSISNKGITTNGEEKIVFASDRDGDYDIWMMNPDGTNHDKLIDTGGNDHSPRISPDGLRIAFCSDFSGNSEIYLMNVNGTNLVNLTNNGSEDGSPDFSPDGTQIAFISDRSGKYDIWVMDSSGGNLTQVTDLPCITNCPCFSPDGEKIVFGHRPNNPGSEFYNDLYEVDLSNNNVTQLTSMGGSDAYPRFSEDGFQIVYNHCESNWHDQVYLMDSDGSNIQEITTGTSWNNMMPCFSPDDQNIVFYAEGYLGDYELYRMDSSGGNWVQLTDDSGRKGRSDWGFVSLEPVNTYTVTYNGNGNTGGTAPVDSSSPYESGEEVTVLGPGDLVKKHYTFTGWNTAADGSGIAYSPLDTFTINSDMVLYAQWTDGVGYGKKILDVPYFDAQGVTNGCGCAAGAMIMNYYNYLDVEPADLAPYIMVPESRYWETFGLLAGIEVYIIYYGYDDNLKTTLKILTIEDIKRKIDKGFPVAVLQYSDLPRITENLHYRVIHGYDDEKLEFICSCSLGEDYSMEYSEFINLNLLQNDECPALIVEPKNIDFSYLDVVPAEGSAPHKVHLAGYVRAVVSPFSCQVDFGDGTPFEEGTGNEFLSLYHTYENKGKFTPVLYVEDNLGRTGKAKANKIKVTQAENKFPFESGDEFAGYKWDVRNYPGTPCGEQCENDFSDSIDNVWMDDLDQLHFRLTKENNNKWNCVEIISQKTGWGYGKYEFDFEIVSNGKIDENVVIGLYTYDSDAPEVYYREFDYEYTVRVPSGIDPTNNNSIVGWQGDPLCNKRFYIPVDEGYPAKIVLYWNYWEDEEIYCYYECGNIVGDFSLLQDADDEDAQTTTPPTTGNERVLMNLWLSYGEPYNLEEWEDVEVVIKNFDFKPKPE